jgi:hypothetical protein
VRRATFAVAVSSAVAFAAKVEAGQPKKAEKKTERSVKAVKSVFAIFQLEPAAVQSVPTQIGGKYFMAFALFLRMGMGGGGPEILILYHFPEIIGANGGARTQCAPRRAAECPPYQAMSRLSVRTGINPNPSPSHRVAIPGMAGRRRRSSVNRIEENI